MPRMADLLWAEENREPLVRDFAQFVETQVASRRGLKGIGLKTTFAMLKSLRPDAMPRALHVLLPRFAEALDPLFQEFAHASEPDFSRFLQGNARRAAQAMLNVTDARVEASTNTSLKKMYARLRGGALDELAEAVPGMGRVMARYLA
jgi:hypothetical protein